MCIVYCAGTQRKRGRFESSGAHGGAADPGNTTGNEDVDVVGAWLTLLFRPQQKPQTNNGAQAS